MGLLREQLINVLACLVTINLALGAVVIYDRSRQVPTMVSAGAPDSNPAPASAGSPGGAGGARPDGSPAGGSSDGRPSPQEQSTAAPAQGGATTPALPSTTASPSTRPTGATGGSTPSRPRSAAPPSGRATTTSTSGAAGVATPPPPAPTGTTGQPTPDDTTPPTHAAPPKPSPTGSSAPPKAAPPSVTTSGVWTVTGDARGDTVIDSTRAPQANDRADMVESRATNTTKAIGFAVKVAQPVDPTRDPIWTSAATFVLWEIDTSGDGTPDFEVEYFVEGGKLVAGVSRVTGSGNQAACEAEAGYMSESYVVGIDPGCLGSPASLSYRATVFYAADPNNDNADSITDVSPDGGLSAPLRRTAA